MRKIGLLSTFFIVLQANLVLAQIPLRSGAHESFSRVVFDVPRGTDWTFEVQETSSFLRLEGHTAGFDTSRVFDRIDRTHVRSVSATDSSVEIEFNCNCTANATLVDETMIVVDIRLSPPEITDVSAEVPKRWFSGSSDTRLAFPVLSQEELTTPQIRPTELATRLDEPGPTSLPSPPLPSQDHEIKSLQQAQQKLAEHIGMAATRGVLRPKNSQIDILTAQRQPQIDIEIFDSSIKENGDQQMPAPIGGNLRISASNDVPTSLTDTQRTSTQFGARCLDPQDVAVQDWAVSENFNQSVSTWRRQLFSDRDTLNSEAAVSLAKVYLHFGFGPEAIQVLEMSSDLAQENAVLIDMGKIMEFGGGAQGEYLQNFVDCDSEVALWAQLASTSLSSSQSINTDAALKALSALPWHLRTFLAPILSQKLLDYGDKDAANMALRSLERTGNESLPDAELARAELELASGNTRDAQARLSNIVSSNSEQSAQALITYVDTQFDAGVQIDDDIATLVEAYAVEMRDDPLGEALRRAHVLALAKSGQYSKAFEELERLSFAHDKTTTAQLRSAALTLLADNADDVEFLELAFQNATIDRPAIDPAARISVAQRLTQLGFFQEAEMLLPQQTQHPMTQKHRILRAEIALGLQRPEEASAILGRTEGEAADRLRALARLENEDYTEAYNLFNQLGDPQSKGHTAWMSEDWLELSAAGGSVIEETAQVSRTELNINPELDGLLARSEEALTESSNARDVLERLLLSKRSQ